MADSSVDLTALTGDCDTRTEATNGNHRQVVVLGDPSTNAGVAPVDGTAGLKVDLGADNDVTVTGTVDLGATDNAVLDSINTNTTTLSGAVSGTEVQVDVVAALPAGTNAIGKLAANSGVDIGDVDVLSMPGTAAEAAALPTSFVVVAGDDGTDTHPLQVDTSGYLKVNVQTVGATPGTTATDTAKAVDSASGSTDTGIALLAVRDNALTTLAAADADYVQLRTNSVGELYTNKAKPTIVSSDGTAITTATTTTLVAAPGASTHLRVEYIHASNSSATATIVSWRDGAAGAKLFETYLPQGGVFAHRIDGGWNLTSNTLLALNTSAAGNVYWTVEYLSVAD